MIILLLDDDCDFVAPLQKRLQMEGHTVFFFETLKQEKKIIAALKKADLILCDFSLPHAAQGSGWSWISKQLKMLKRPPSLVYLMSGFGFDHASASGAIADFNLGGYLPKPFPISAVLKIIQEKNC